MDIADFIEARLSEDEASALAATPGPWEFEGDDPTDDELFTVHQGEHGDLIGQTVAWTRGHSQQQANGFHMARHDPARVMREVETKRALLRVATNAYHLAAADIDDQILRALAAIWCAHPEFDPDWAHQPAGA